MSSLFGKPTDRVIDKMNDGPVSIGTAAPPAPPPAPQAAKPPEPPAPARSILSPPPRMPEPSMRPDAAAPADGRAHLDRGTKVEGKLSFDCPVWIDGEVSGEIAAKESVTIGEAAVITASVHAGSVVVSGKVSGNISATNRIELRPSARAECDLAAPVIVILEGAEFEGHCSMRPDGAERKISVLPGAEHPAHRANDKARAAAS